MTLIRRNVSYKIPLFKNFGINQHELSEYVKLSNPVNTYFAEKLVASTRQKNFSKV